MKDSISLRLCSRGSWGQFWQKNVKALWLPSPTVFPPYPLKPNSSPSAGMTSWVIQRLNALASGLFERRIREYSPGSFTSKESFRKPLKSFRPTILRGVALAPLYPIAKIMKPSRVRWYIGRERPVGSVYSPFMRLTSVKVCETARLRMSLRHSSHGSALLLRGTSAVPASAPSAAPRLSHGNTQGIGAAR